MAPIEEMEEYPPSLHIDDLPPNHHFAFVKDNIKNLRQEANCDILLYKEVTQNGPIINYPLTPSIYLLLTSIIQDIIPQMAWWAKRCRISIPDLYQPYINPEVCRLEGPISLWPGRNYTSIMVLLGTTAIEVEIIRRGRRTGDTYTWNPNSALILQNGGLKMTGLGNIKIVCITYFSNRNPPRNFQRAPISPYQYSAGYPAQPSSSAPRPSVQPARQSPACQSPARQSSAQPPAQYVEYRDEQRAPQYTDEKPPNCASHCWCRVK